ncbi:MAG: phosphoenolpyruvate--protein phosphotransferase [Erysipelotrichaceae bacterium]|nr:phosphoenolpyruvate--protein phosphotransferase [Erysipelotrichaceae bacterium]
MNIFQGTGLGGGRAAGRVHHLIRKELQPALKKRSIAEEKALFEQAVKKVQEEILRTKEEARTLFSEEELSIYDTHYVIVSDPEIVSEVFAAIENGASAEQAVRSVGSRWFTLFSSMSDPLFASRSEDIRDVVRQVLRNLQDGGLQKISLPQDCILCASSISLQEVGMLEAGNLKGIILGKGNPLSHVAIILRTLRIPVILNAEGTASLAEGSRIAVDGDSGLIYSDPDEETLELFRTERKTPAPFRPQTALPVRVCANIASLQDAKEAARLQADGVGLCRTEFLFMDTVGEPTEEEQFALYREILQLFPDSPVWIRTLDINSDKRPRWLPESEEKNPDLGIRGLRFSLRYPTIFKTQLRALLRASAYGRLGIMLPLVTFSEEIRETKKILEECRQELQQKDIPYGECTLGIMVETPAAALQAAELAKEVDFFSIGTNDLTQYTHAADRLNEDLSAYSKPSPALKVLVQRILDAARDAGIPCGMCGTLCADPRYTDILVEMGLKEFSVNIADLPQIRQSVSDHFA